jgi:hypothetical protein
MDEAHVIACDANSVTISGFGFNTAEYKRVTF